MIGVVNSINSLQTENIAIFIPILVVIGVFLSIIINTIVSGIKQSADTKETERTRREIAAYIAEGSMTPEEGERILTAGRTSKKA